MKKIGKFLIIISIIIVIVIAIIVGVLVIAFFVIGIKTMKEPSDITDIPKSLSISYSKNDEGFGWLTENEERPELQWYGTVEEALENDELIKDTDIGRIDYKEAGAVELLQIQTDSCLTVFYSTALENGEVGRITYVILEVKAGKYSQPFEIGMAGRRPGFYSESGKPRHIYDCDDGAVFYIEWELVYGGGLGRKFGPIFGPVFGTGENRIPVCFGMWDDEAEIRSLTIAGVSPKVVPVTARDETRYFWYFEDLEWADRLSEVDWSDYTYGEIIELLEIEYGPSGESDE